MTQRKRFFICLAALLAWIAFIFCRSMQPAAASETESQWALDLLQRFAPFGLTMHFVRKLAHFTEFAVLGVLAGLMFPDRRLRVWLPPAALLGLLTALCDETIQLFVAGRTGKLPDVWLDFAGVTAGLIFVLVVGFIAGRKKKA